MSTGNGKPKSLRIRFEGNEHRRDAVEGAAALWDCGKTKAVVRACEHARRDARSKQRALDYMDEHLAGKHRDELARILSTPHVSLAVDVVEHVDPDPDR